MKSGRKLCAKRSGAVAAAAVGLVLAPAWSWAQGPKTTDNYVCGEHMMHWGGGWYGMVFGPLFMLLALGVLIAVAVLVVRSLGGPWAGAEQQPALTPLDVLKERYARGEIDKDEFEERRRVLGD